MLGSKGFFRWVCSARGGREGKERVVAGKVAQER
jgi:hypothetical protein